MARAEEGRHCNVQSITFESAQGGLMHLKHIGA